MPIATYQMNRVLQNFKNHFLKKNWDHINSSPVENSIKINFELSDRIRMKTANTIRKKLATIINRDIFKDEELNHSMKFQTDRVKLKFEDNMQRKIKFSFNRIDNNNCKNLITYDDLTAHRFLRFSLNL